MCTIHGKTSGSGKTLKSPKSLKSSKSPSKGIMKTHGPGIWFAFHTMSLAASTRETSIFLAYFIKATVRRFRCPICKGHALQYLRKNPPELSIKNLFAWTVDFHNDVNYRNDKRCWGYQEAYNYYKVK